MSSFGPWTRNEVLDLHIFILLIIWMTLDRSNIYFSDIVRALRLARLYLKAYFMRPTNSRGPM